MGQSTGQKEGQTDSDGKIGKVAEVIPGPLTRTQRETDTISRRTATGIKICIRAIHDDTLAIMHPRRTVVHLYSLRPVRGERLLDTCIAPSDLLACAGASEMLVIGGGVLFCTLHYPTCQID